MTAFQRVAIPTEQAQRFGVTGNDDNVARRIEATDRGIGRGRTMRASCDRMQGDIVALRAWWTSAQRTIERAYLACREAWRDCRDRDHLAALDDRAIDDLGRHRVAAELARTTSLHPSLMLGRRAAPPR